MEGCSALSGYKEKAYKSLAIVGIDPEAYKQELRKAIDFYLSLGFSVVPIKLVHESVGDDAKQPLVMWGEYSKRHPTKEEIDEWFKKFEVFNIAIVTGKISGITVLDIDDYSVLEGKIPIEEWMKKCPVQKTGKEEGYHIFFKGAYKSEVISSNPDVRLKGEGGYVLAYPSVHPSGRQYKFVSPLSLLYLSEEPDFEKLVRKLKEVLGVDEGEDKNKKDKVKKQKKKYVKIVWEAIPPCITKSLEIRRRTVHEHEVNVFLRDFFMFITENNDQVLEIFKENSPESEFNEEMTAKQINYWWSKRYLPVNCENLYSKVPQLAELKPCDSCDLSVRNPIVYYKVKSRAPIVPKSKAKVTEEIPPELRKYVPEKFTSFRKDQATLIVKITEHVVRGEDVVLNPPTGYGKTLVYTTVAKLLGKPTVIITCDKELQNQIEEYGVLPIKGKDNYVCPIHNIKASYAPCSTKRNYMCEEECEWKKVNEQFEFAMKNGGIVAVNFGNWFRAKKAKFVVVDEFHETVARMCRPICIHRFTDDVRENIELNLRAVEDHLEELRDHIEHLDPDDKDYLKIARRISNLKNLKDRLEFFLENIDHVFDYCSKDGKKYFVELDLVGTLKRLDETINAPKLWVSATPVMFKDMPIVTTDYRVADKTNAPIIYMPLTKLTVARVKRNPDVLRLTAYFIDHVFRWARKAIGTRKAIVYTGNTTTHMKVAAYLAEFGWKLIRHTGGDLERVVKEFKEKDYDFLCATAIEAGYDFDEPEINLIFIEKIPYPDRSDPKWDGLKKRFGEERFREEYDRVAVNLIQQVCGRVSRSEDKASLVYILDKKFEELFRDRNDWFTQDFKDRLVWAVSS